MCLFINNTCFFYFKFPRDLVSMKKGGNIFNLNTNIRDIPITKENPTKMTFNEGSRPHSDNKVENVLSIKEYFYNKKMQLYKTEICRSHSEIGYCKYGSKCQFAHDISELRNVNRHPRYKTETCRTFWEEGSCPYGKRCCFIHIKNKFIEPIDKTKDTTVIKPKYHLESPQSVDESTKILIYKDTPVEIKEQLVNKISEKNLIKNELDEEYDFEDDMFNSIDSNVNKTHKEATTGKFAINEVIPENLINEYDTEKRIIKDEYNFNDEMEFGQFIFSDKITHFETGKIEFELPDDFNCKDYDLDRDTKQRKWSDKQIKLSPEDALFINSLLVTERRPFWEVNDTSLWTDKPLFYVRMNNHKWK